MTESAAEGAVEGGNMILKFNAAAEHVAEGAPESSGEKCAESTTACNAGADATRREQLVTENAKREALAGKKATKAQSIPTKILAMKTVTRTGNKTRTTQRFRPERTTLAVKTKTTPTGEEETKSSSCNCGESSSRQIPLSLHLWR